MAQAKDKDPRAHTIYRGCTHPPTFFGVPVVIFVFSVIAFALPGFWLLSFNALVSFGIWLMYVPVFVGMRWASRRDPYTLTQYGQRVMRRVRHGNTRRWGALTYTPFRYDR